MNQSGLANALVQKRQYVLAVIVGAASGVLISALSRISALWAVIGVLVALFATVLVAAGQLRRPLLALLAFAVPLSLDVNFLVYPFHHEGGANGFGIAFKDIVLLLLIFLALGEMALRKPVRLRLFAGVTFPALLFMALGAVSSVFAPNPQLTAYQVLEIMKGLVLYLYVANFVRDDQDIRWVLTGLMAVVLFESSLGLYQSLAGRTLGLSFIGERDTAIRQIMEGRVTIRPTGTFWHANALAMYLGMALPVIAGLLLAPVKRGAKLGAAAVIMVGLITLAYTLSRGAWIGVCLAAVLLLAFALSRKVISPAHLAPGLMVAAALVIALNLLAGGAIIRRLTVYDRGSAQVRIPLMRGALTVAADYPILGSGLNNYSDIIMTYDSAAEYTQSGILPVVHNVFLLFAAETGLLGLGAFLWLLAALGIRGFRYLQGRGVTLTTCLTAGLLASGLSLVVHCMVDLALVGDMLLFVQFWFLAGLLVAATALRPIASSS